MFDMKAPKSIDMSTPPEKAEIDFSSLRRTSLLKEHPEHPSATAASRIGIGYRTVAATGRFSRGKRNVLTAGMPNSLAIGGIVTNCSTRRDLVVSQ
jgi:hypothetical protein